jgi:hypothetical protein
MVDPVASAAGSGETQARPEDLDNGARRVCVTCGRAKPLTSFYVIRGPAEYGNHRARRCIDCCQIAVNQAVSEVRPNR